MNRVRKASARGTGTLVGIGLVVAIGVPILHWVILEIVAAGSPPTPSAGVLAQQWWIFALELAAGLLVVVVAASGGRGERWRATFEPRALPPSLFAERLNEELARSRSNRAPLAVLVVELGGQRATWRDRAEVARVLRGACRPSDVVGRYGKGDSLAVLAPDTDGRGALALAALIRRALLTSYIERRHSLPPGPVSVGATHVAPGRDSSPALLVASASSALERARSRGGDCTVLADAEAK